MSNPLQPSRREEFEIVLLCALPLEYDAVSLLFDEFWDEDGDHYGKAAGDPNNYTTGRIGKYNVVLALLPHMGKANAASAAASVRSSYINLRLALLVGICGGVPKGGKDEDDEVLLGDVVVSKAIVQYDFGRRYPDKFVRKDTIENNLGRPNKDIRNLLAALETDLGLERLQQRITHHLKELQVRAIRQKRRAKYNYPGTAEDKLFKPSYRHKHHGTPPCICKHCNEKSDPVCEEALNSSCGDLQCDETYLVPRELLKTKGQLEQDDENYVHEPAIHIGRIASSDTVMKSGEDRDRIAKQDGVIAFEMEGAGVWDEVPCVVIKGVCDYADCHKNKRWQNFAAATAAAAMKALLERYIQTDKYMVTLTYRQTVSPPKANTVDSRQDRWYEVPARRVSDFIGREQLLSEIERSFNTKTGTKPCTVILRGMGGQGKTQLALEYCRRAFESNRFSAIFWADATTESTIRKSFESISEVVKHQHKVFLDNNSRVAFVKATFSGWLHPWLIVFDNYDNPSIFTNVCDFMPRGGQGNILVTSRHADSDRLGSVIDINGMQEDEALEFLLKRTGYPVNDENSEEGKNIVRRLGFHALAIDQSSSFISKRKLPLRKFIDLYNRRKKLVLESTPSLWEYRRKLSMAEGETSLSVFTTWELSFQQIGVETGDQSWKAQILTIFGFLHYENISEELFRAYHSLCPPEETPEWMKLFVRGNGDWDSDMFWDILAELRTLSLVQDFAHENGQFLYFSLHPLVSDWIKLRTGGQILQECILESVMIVQDFLKTCYNGKEHFDLSSQAKQAVLLHMNACEQNIKEFLEPENRSQLGTHPLNDAGEWFAKFYYSVGRFREAEDLYKLIFKDREKRLGANNTSVLDSLAKLAIVLQHQAKYEAAEEMHQKTLERREKVLGKEHPDTLTSVDNLGEVFQYQGKYEAAEEMNRRALEGRKRMLGAEHPDTLTSVSNWAWVLWRQGKYKVAEEINRQVLDRREKVLGREHPDTLTSVNNLGTVLESQRKYKAAEAMFRRALEEREKTLGKEHPSTLTTVSNLAWVLCRQGKDEAAEEMNWQALEGREKVFGKEHPDTLTSVNNLGAVLLSQGKYDGAEVMYRMALEGREKALGKVHHRTLSSAYNLGLSLESQGKYAAAEKTYRSVVEGLEIAVGKEHPDTLDSISRLASVLWQQKKYAAAEMYRRKLEGNDKELGR